MLHLQGVLRRRVRGPVVAQAARRLLRLLRLQLRLVVLRGPGVLRMLRVLCLRLRLLTPAWATDTCMGC
ncbi:hypothetical protein GPN2_12521 [Streptomyces murinus]